MIRIVILYPNTNDNWFDKEYYMNRHVPMVKELLEPYGLIRFELDWGIAGLSGQAPYLAIGYLLFDSMEQFQKAMAAEGQKLTSDIPNYTRDAVVQIGQNESILEMA